MRVLPLALAALTLLAFTPLLVPSAEASPICVKNIVCVNPPCTTLGCPPNIWCNQFYCIHPPCTSLLGCPINPWCNPTYCILL